MFRRFCLLVLVAATATGCDLGTGDPEIQFSHSLLPSAEGVQSSASLQPGNNAIFAVGIIKTPNSCQKLTASARQTSTELTITITASSQRSDCPGGQAAYTYELAVADITAGRFTVKVIYDFSGQKPAETAHTQELVIT